MIGLFSLSATDFETRESAGDAKISSEFNSSLTALRWPMDVMVRNILSKERICATCHRISPRSGVIIRRRCVKGLSSRCHSDR